MREILLPSVEGTLGPQSRGVVALPSMAAAERKRASQRFQEMCQNDPWKVRESPGEKRKKEDPESWGMQRVRAAGTPTEETPGAALSCKCGQAECRTGEAFYCLWRKVSDIVAVEFAFHYSTASESSIGLTVENVWSTSLFFFFSIDTRTTKLCW